MIMIKLLRVLLILFVFILCAASVIILRQSSPALFNLAYFLGLVMLLIKALYDAVHNRFHLFILFLVALSLFVTQFDTIQNTLVPITRSPNIEIRYNLKSPEFMEDNKVELTASTGDKVVLEKVPGQTNYHIYLPFEIEDINTFYTSYDNNGINIGRMTWTKNIDYTFSKNCIETKHRLNDTFNDSKGRHIIVYEYRSPIFTQIYAQVQALWQNLGTTSKTVFRLLWPFGIALMVFGLIFTYFRQLWILIQSYFDRILLGIIFVIALRLNMQILAIAAGAIFIIGAHRAKTFLCIIMYKLEKAPKGSVPVLGSWDHEKEIVSLETHGTPFNPSGIPTEEINQNMTKALELIDQKRPAEARECLEKIESFDPYDFHIQTNLGMAYDLIDEYDRSIEHSQKALEISPGSFVPQFNLAVATNHRDGAQKSLDEYKKAEQLALLCNISDKDPITMGKLYLFLGHDYRDLEKFKTAQYYYEKAQQIFTSYPGNPIAERWLKDTYYNLDKMNLFPKRFAVLVNNNPFEVSISLSENGLYINICYAHDGNPLLKDNIHITPNTPAHIIEMLTSSQELINLSKDLIESELKRISKK